jgi:hypothetical protein
VAAAPVDLQLRALDDLRPLLGRSWTLDEVPRPASSRSHGIISCGIDSSSGLVSSKKLHQGAQSPPLVTAGDIWWASVGQNVGSEINGKSRLFSRPRLLLRNPDDNQAQGRVVVRALPPGRPQDDRVSASGTCDRPSSSLDQARPARRQQFRPSARRVLEAVQMIFPTITRGAAGKSRMYHQCARHRLKVK